MPIEAILTEAGIHPLQAHFRSLSLQKEDGWYHPPPSDDRHELQQKSTVT